VLAEAPVAEATGEGVAEEPAAVEETLEEAAEAVADSEAEALAAEDEEEAP